MVLSMHHIFTPICNWTNRIQVFLQLTLIINCTRYFVLGEPKYGPGSKPHWKAGRARYMAFYKALLEEPLITQSIEMVRARTREYLYWIHT